MNAEDLSDFILKALVVSGRMEVEGLGTFTRTPDGRITFRRGAVPRVFIAYALEDAAFAERLFNELRERGFSPWMDRKKLLPGQNWSRRIEDAICGADFFIGCFSRTSVRKRGGFQKELRCALSCAGAVPLDDVFLIPVRLDDCRLPLRIQRETHYVDLFPNWEAGVSRIVEMMQRQLLSI